MNCHPRQHASLTSVNTCNVIAQILLPLVLAQAVLVRAFELSFLAVRREMSSEMILVVKLLRAHRARELSGLGRSVDLFVALQADFVLESSAADVA